MLWSPSVPASYIYYIYILVLLVYLLYIIIYSIFCNLLITRGRFPGHDPEPSAWVCQAWHSSRMPAQASENRKSWLSYLHLIDATAFAYHKNETNCFSTPERTADTDARNQSCLRQRPRSTTDLQAHRRTRPVRHNVGMGIGFDQGDQLLLGFLWDPRALLSGLGIGSRGIGWNIWGIQWTSF